MLRAGGPGGSESEYRMLSDLVRLRLPKPISRHFNQRGSAEGVHTFPSSSSKSKFEAVTSDHSIP